MSNSSGSAATAVEEKEEPQCPPGLRQYETMAVLRPDMSEDERLSLTQKYEEVYIIYIFFLYFFCNFFGWYLCIFVMGMFR